MTAVHWAPLGHPGHYTHDPRLVDAPCCQADTRYLLAVLAGATAAAWHKLTQPLARWWAGTRACLTTHQPATPCGRTRDDGTFTWRCGLNAHTGPCHDPAYGTFT